MEQARQLLRFKLPKFSFEGKPQLGVQSHASLLEVWGALAESAWRDLKPAMIDQAQGVVRQTGWSVSVQPILLGPEVYNNKALREQLTRLTILTLSARPLVCGVRQTSAHQILVTCPSARAITTFKMELRDRWVSSLRPVVPQLKGIITEAAAPQMISSVPHEQARFLVRHASH